MRLEGTLNHIFFLVVVAEEGRAEGVVLNVAVLGWYEIAAEGTLGLVMISSTSCHQVTIKRL